MVYPPELFKVGVDALNEALNQLLSKNTEDKRFPRNLKTAVFTPLIKTGHVTKLENYRDIFLVSIAFTILENFFHR